MKRKYLLTLALAGMLAFGNAPITASAASPTAGGTIVDEQQGDAGDVLNLDESGLPLAEGEGSSDEADIEDEGTPLAVLSTDTQTTSRFSWWGFVLGFLTATVLETAVWAVTKSRKDDEKTK